LPARSKIEVLSGLRAKSAACSRPESWGQPTSIEGPYAWVSQDGSVCLYSITFIRRYARYSGGITINAAAVPKVANWAMPSIPRSIAPDHLRRVLASCNRRSAVGSRDYAILLLLARLGLRAGAIALLELDDVDWHAATLRVRGKGGHPHVLPLPVEVGEAIATYLKIGRPSAPTADCSSVRGRPIGASKARWQCSVSLDTHSSVPESIRHPKVHISSVTPWLARCCGGARHCPRSARYWTTAIPRRRPFMRRSMASLHTLALAWPGGA
jgi:integrase